LQIIQEKIHDNRFLRLLKNLLQAGYLEEWKYHSTQSGAPQGGIASPILANIYLDRLDTYMEHILLPAYNRGDRRKANPDYRKLLDTIRALRQQGREEEALALRKEAQRLPSQMLQDPDYRRLRYLRYADDFLLGFIGPRQEAEEIKQQLQRFLQEQLNLELSAEKTLITHARSEKARFLGYEIEIFQEDTYQETQGHTRSINGKVGLAVPMEVIRDKSRKFLHQGKPIHRVELIHNSDFAIVSQYQSEYRGITQYYQLAHNLHRFQKLKWIMERSLTMTLSRKLRISVPKVYDRYRATLQTDQGSYTGLQIRIERNGKKPLVATWGGIPLKRRKMAILKDSIWQPNTATRNELLDRLRAEECELCGSREGIEVHHIRALKDLHQPGRKEKPDWMKIMAARHRKTLVVCQRCHRSQIHTGCYDGKAF
jgi:hypothetical protein